MKDLLLVVPLHPKRKPRAREWLDKQLLQIKEEVIVHYLEPTPVGGPIFGLQGQEYTAAPINRALFNSVYEEWKQWEGKFFGYCCDDVVVTEPDDVLQRMMDLLNFSDFEATGAPHEAMKTFRDMPLLSRFWIVCTDCLPHTTWNVLWDTYHFPEFEPMWMHYSKLKTVPFPGLKFSHLRPRTCDMSNIKEGWVIEYYDGLKTQRRGEFVYPDE